MSERKFCRATATRARAVGLALLVTGSVTGCGDNLRLSEVAELVRAVDTNADPGIVEVELVAVEARVEYLEGTRTDVLAYRDGSIAGSSASVPGPMIEAKVGDRLIVHFRNELDEPTTIHWHGLRLPIEMDGDPAVSDEVPPGGTFDYDFTVRDAGFFWYHPHVNTDAQIEMGLQGPLVVRGSGEPALFERFFVLDDIDLAGDGSIRIEPSLEDVALGRRGDTLLVNGRPPGAVRAASGAIERWRIVNTSNGRFLNLELTGLPFRVIGWDGGLIPQPYDVDRLLIAPGERYDVVVDLDRSAGDTVVLRTLEVDRGHNAVDPGPLELVRIELDDTTPAPSELPSTGPAISPIVVSAQTVRRRFVFREDLGGPAGSVFFINDERWPLNTHVPVTLGDVEIWEIVNDADSEHPVHVHGHFWQVLDRDGVPETRLGWKDTVAIGPRSTVRAALVYDEPGKWMFHCQITEHAERGMTADVDVQP